MSSVTPIIFFCFTAYLLFKLLAIGRRAPDLPPGPKTLPLVGNLLQFPTAAAHAAFARWARIYGDIFSLKMGSKDLIILTSPTATREILEQHGLVTADRPSNFIADAITGGYHLPFMSEGPRWKTLRQTVRTILSQQACKGHLGIQQAESARLMWDLLRQPKEHYTHFQRYALSVIMAVTFGQTVNSNSQETKSFIRNAHDFNHIMGPGQTPPIDLLPILRYIPSWWKAAVEDIRQRHQEFYRRLLGAVRDRVENGDSRGSFTQSVLEREESLGMTPEMTLGLSQAILETGSDTSGAFLQNACLFLLANPHVQCRAHEELDRVVGRERSPGMSDIKNLPYVRAVIEEVHRLRPVAPLGIPHAATQDIHYRGKRIPAGSMIIANLFGTFRSPEFFEKPDVFNPDRYMRHPLGIKEGVNEDDVIGLKDYVYGFGKRSCPGILLAKNGLYLNLANLLWGFDILKALGPEGKPIEPDQLVLVTPSFECDIRPRSVQHANVIRQNFLDGQHVSLAFEEDLTEEDRRELQAQRDQAVEELLRDSRVKL